MRLVYPHLEVVGINLFKKIDEMYLKGIAFHSAKRSTVVTYFKVS